mmetsp:Transcript_37362/g.86208  ORF Transcript_37362/g.86208 Transcript_37362/m.86208 type:complete len:123 (-) Transcript_37362:908-1276(-)
MEATEDVRDTLLLPRRLSHPCSDAGDRVRRPTALWATDLMVSSRDATPTDEVPPLLRRRCMLSVGSIGDPGALPRLTLLLDLSAEGIYKGGVLGPLLGEKSSPKAATSTSSSLCSCGGGLLE